MPSRRFQRLEMEPDAARGAPDAAAPEAEVPPTPAFRRALEVEGALGLDESGATRTHFCRACGCENSEGARACSSCGGVLGGPEQESFDARARASRRSAGARALEPVPRPPAPPLAAEARPAAHPIPRDTDGLLQEILRESEHRHEPGFGSVLSAGVLFAALFALVWIPVRTAFALGSGAPLQGRALVELAFSAVGALWLRRRFRRELDGL